MLFRSAEIQAKLVNINQTTVNLPFSLFSIYIFQYIICLIFDYWQYSILTLNGLLACCLRPFSLDFDLVRMDFLLDLPKLFFLLQYLSIFCESTLAPVYIQESTLDAQSKALKMYRTDRKITTKISRSFL